MPPDYSQHKIVSRRRLVLWFVLGLAAAVPLILLVQHLGDAYVEQIERLAEQDPAAAARQALSALRVVFGILALLIAGVGLYLVWLGARARRSGLFPPPGSWVVEGRPVYTGSRATRVGLLQIMLGAVLVVMAGGIVFYCWVVLERLFERALT